MTHTHFVIYVGRFNPTVSVEGEVDTKVCRMAIDEKDKFAEDAIKQLLWTAFRTAFLGQEKSSLKQN